MNNEKVIFKEYTMKQPSLLPRRLLENYFVAGTKIGANANAHKVIWAKKTRHYKERLQEQIKSMLDEIELVTEKENQE